MTFNEWYENRTTLDAEQGRAVYEEITGDAEGAEGYSGAIQFDAGFLMVTNDGLYDAICGRDQLISRSLLEAARFLWDEHSKYEVA